MAGEVWRVGAVRIARILELESTGLLGRLIPEATRERVREIGWLYPHFADAEGRMRASIHALVVETPQRRIVVDTCLGNDKPRPVPAWNRLQTRFIEDMATAGYGADSIDTVLCTHLHLDHVGWNTRLDEGKWVPTFPHARYLIARQEYAHWVAAGTATEQAQVMADSVLPIRDAGLMDLVDTDHVICPEVRLLPTPGHTPGHVSVWIESQGSSALITGDILHHPCQMAHPQWAAVADCDSVQAAAMRRSVLESHGDGPTLIIGTHFATPTAGYLKRDGAGWRLDIA